MRVVAPRADRVAVDAVPRRVVPSGVVSAHLVQGCQRRHELLVLHGRYLVLSRTDVPRPHPREVDRGPTGLVPVHDLLEALRQPVEGVARLQAVLEVLPRGLAHERRLARLVPLLLVRGCPGELGFRPGRPVERSKMGLHLLRVAGFVRVRLGSAVVEVDGVGDAELGVLRGRVGELEAELLGCDSVFAGRGGLRVVVG